MTLPRRLTEVLRDPADRRSPLEYLPEDHRLFSPKSGTSYDVVDGVPSLLVGAPVKSWELDALHKMGDSYYLRAKGDLPEKESSKSYARLMKREGLYRPGDTVLDVGCASGHFLRSFHRLLDPEIRYTGIDTHLQYLQWGAEIFGVGDGTTFLQCDALNIPVVDDAFDITVVNLYHTFPNLKDSLAEGVRVTRKKLIWRGLIGEANYLVKIVYDDSFENLGVLTHNREDIVYTQYMIYTEQYVRGLAESLGVGVDFVRRDDDFEPFDNTKIDSHKGIPSTKTVNGMQLNGSLILDWHYVVIDCS